MNLYLMRHGIAAERADTGQGSDDRARPLTAKGIKRMSRAAEGLVALSLTFDRILTSPLERAPDRKDRGADSAIGRARQGDRAAFSRPIGPESYRCSSRL